MIYLRLISDVSQTLQNFFFTFLDSLLSENAKKFNFFVLV